jgi:hypothetical protein
MTGKLYIDGADAYTNYGIYIASGSYAALLSFPPLKSIDSNDWPEEDGIEADLSEPRLGTRELALKFGSADRKRANDFFDAISDGAYHTFNFAEIGRTYNLRLVSQQNINVVQDAELFTLQFANDFPFTENYEYAAPQSTAPVTGAHELDGIDFSSYGITVLKGSLAELLKSPAVKKNLLTDINDRHGATYDGENVFFQSKEVKLNCHMAAGTLAEFWRNYDAFLYDLSRSGERRLFIGSEGEEYPCYYKNMSAVNFSLIGKVWFQFSLTLVFTSFRVGEVQYLLASEDKEIIITEKEEHAIDLKE